MAIWEAMDNATGGRPEKSGDSHEFPRRDIASKQTAYDAKTLTDSDIVFLPAPPS